MTFLRNIWNDLIERRMWPVALVLVAALVAVPVVLGAGRGTDAAGVVAPVESPGATTQVTLEPTAFVRADRPGVLRNPFKPRVSLQAAVAAVGATPDAAADTGASPGGGAAAPPSSGSGGGTSPSTDTPPTTPSTTPSTTPAPTSPAPKAPVTFTVRARIGRITSPRPVKDFGRLAPLPSSEEPFLVLLGVLADKRTAVFLPSKDVVASGEGRCRPSTAICETVELAVGETERFAVTGADGKVLNYDLDLLRIAGSDGYVALPRKRQGGYELDPRAGVLERVPTKLTARSRTVAGIRIDGLRAFSAATPPAAPAP